MRKKKVLSSSDFIAVSAYGRGSSEAACLYTPDIAKTVLPSVHQVVKHSLDLAREPLPYLDPSPFANNITV